MMTFSPKELTAFIILVLLNALAIGITLVLIAKDPQLTQDQRRQRIIIIAIADGLVTTAAVLYFLFMDL